MKRAGMYSPSAFVETDLAALDHLAAANTLLSLITVRDTTPSVTHLPMLYRRVVGKVELRGHWARPNPQSGHAGAALAILQGPDAYVSPAWYPDKESQARVPTWNYAIAHLHGELVTFDDTASLARLVSDLSDHHEAAAGSDWRFEPGREAHARQLRGIVGFRMQVERISLTFKLNQNHPRANRVAVAERLDALATDRSRGVAALMRERLDE